MANFDQIWDDVSTSQNSESGNDFSKIFDEAVATPDQSASDETIGTAAKLLDAITFGAGDEALASATGLYTKLRYGLPYEESKNIALADIREQERVLQEKKPGLTFLAQLLTGAKIPIPYANKIFTQAPGVLNAAKNIGKGAALGAGMGSLYGFGEGEGDVANRLESAQGGAGMGAITGGLFTGAIEGVQGGVKYAKPAYNYIADLFPTTAKIEQSVDDVARESLSKTTDLEKLKKVLETTPTTGFNKYKSTAELADDPQLGSLQKTLENDFGEARTAEQTLSKNRELTRSKLLNKEQGVVTTDEQLGKTLQEALDKTLGIAKSTVNDAYAATEGITGTANLAPAKKSAFYLLKENADLGLFPSKDVQVAIKNLNELPVRVSFDQLNAQRKHIGNLLGTYRSKLDKTVTDKTNIGILSGMFSKLDDIEEAATQGITGKTKAGEIKGFPTESADLIKTARNIAREKGQTFDQGAVGQILRKDNYGNKVLQPSDVFKKAISSPEDARQVVKALRAEAFGEGTPLTSENARWNLGSNLFSLIRDKSTSTTTGELLPASFSNNWAKFKDVAHEVLDASQIKAINQVEKDLLNQASFQASLNTATKGNSMTAQRLGTAGVVKQNITRAIKQKLGTVGKMIDFLGVENASLIESRVDETLIKFAFDPKFAKEFLGKPTPDKVERIIPALMDDLGSWLNNINKGSALAGTSAAEVGTGSTNPEVEIDRILEKSLMIGKQNENTNSVYNDIFSKKKVSEPTKETAQTGSVGKSNIAAVESVIDQDPYLSTLYEVESGRNPLAKNPVSTAKGAFQFIDSTAKAVGLDDPYDLEKSLVAIKKLTDENRARFGDDPTLLYSAHYLGATVLNKLLKGLPLKPTEQAQVDYLKTKVLPKFNKIYRSKIGQVEA